jgi:hypothetical protein
MIIYHGYKKCRYHFEKLPIVGYTLWFVVVFILFTILFGAIICGIDFIFLDEHHLGSDVHLTILFSILYASLFVYDDLVKGQNIISRNKYETIVGGYVIIWVLFLIFFAWFMILYVDDIKRPIYVLYTIYTIYIGFGAIVSTAAFINELYRQLKVDQPPDTDETRHLRLLRRFEEKRNELIDSKIQELLEFGMKEDDICNYLINDPLLQ